MNTTYPYGKQYWATHRGVRDIWYAIGEDYPGGEQNFQHGITLEVVKISRLCDIEEVK